MSYPFNKYRGENHWNFGRAPWNKNLTKEVDKRVLDYSKTLTGRKLSESHRKSLLGNKNSLGRIYVMSDITKERIRKSGTWYKKGHIPWSKIVAGTGALKAWNKGLGKGIRTNRRKEMESFKHASWRTKVFQRDDYTCKECGEKGGKLQADHIKMWSLYPKLRYELSNGQTLCENCHIKKTRKELSVYWKNQYQVSIGMQRAIK